jgi:hypothetical protein
MVTDNRLSKKRPILLLRETGKVEFKIGIQAVCPDIFFCQGNLVCIQTRESLELDQPGDGSPFRVFNKGKIQRRKKGVIGFIGYPELRGDRSF